MITVDLRGLEDVQRLLRNLATEQIPYATVVTLNNLAFAVQKTSANQLATTFDQPTPLIKGATRVTKATKESLTSRTYLDDPRSKILITHELGGNRGLQTLERFLRGKGWLPSGYRAVPMPNMPLDAYGNPRRAEINKIMESLASGMTGKRTTTTTYFLIPLGVGSRLHPGIYLKKYGTSGAGTGNYRVNAITPMYWFSSKPEYQAILKWDDTMREEALRIAPEEARKAVERAIETAR